MKMQLAAIFLALSLPHTASAMLADGPGEKPEEIIIKGQQQLLKSMLAAEARAYDVFNQYNDEKRFRISCSKYRPTNTHFETQSCAPEFEIQASKGHAVDYLESFRPPQDNDGNALYGNVEQQHGQYEAEVARQKPAYKRKMQEIAAQHPEFVEAIKEYAKLRDQYAGKAASDKK